MLATIAMLILVMGLAVSVSYNIMNLNKSNTDLINSQRNVLFVESWKTKIVNNAKALGENGEYILPFGENRTNYHTVPSWIEGSTYNPYGSEIIYCPYGSNNTGTLSATINVTNSITYNAEMLSNFATVVNGSSRNYVSSSTSPAHPVLGFLISPLNHSSSLPNCNEITYNSANEVYTVSNGIVREITQNDLKVFNQTKNLTQNDLVYFENTIEGDSSASGNTLKANIQYIINSNIPKAKLSIPSGTHLISDLDLYSVNYSENNFEILLEGSGSGSTIIASENITSEITINNYNIDFRNIEIKNDIQVTINSSKARFKDSNVSNLVSNNSKLEFDNTILKSGDLNNEALYLYNTEFKLRNLSSTIEQNINNTNAINSIKSNIIIEGVSLNINNSSIGNVVYLDSSDLINYGTININTSTNHESNIFITEDSYFKNEGSITLLSGNSNFGIINYGRLSFNASNIRNNSSGNNTLILLETGSMLTLKNNSQVSQVSSITRPSNAIVDNGARFINGATATVFANNYCWSGDIFSETHTNPSSIGLNGTNSNTSNNMFRMFNRSNWNCII